MSFAVHFSKPNPVEENVIPPEELPDNEDAPAKEIEKVVTKQPVPTQGLSIHITNDAHENFL